MVIFVNTSALFAILDAGDRAHSSAGEFWADGLSQGWTFRTTNYVLSEASALVQRRLGMAVLQRLHEDVRPAVVVDWVDEPLHNAGMSLVLASGRRNLSLVDCTSFSIMRQAGIKDVFAFDPHFAEQGFDVLPASGSGAVGAQGAER